MSEDRRPNLSEPHQRVRWARERVFESAEKAAEALGMPGSTYRQYERGKGSSRWATLDGDYAKAFGRKFKVSWAWLLTGVGSHAPDDKMAELASIFMQMSDHQQGLLLDLARNMVPADNVVQVDALPKALAGTINQRTKRTG